MLPANDDVPSLSKTNPRPRVFVTSPSGVNLTIFKVIHERKFCINSRYLVRIWRSRFGRMVGIQYTSSGYELPSLSVSRFNLTHHSDQSSVRMSTWGPSQSAQSIYNGITHRGRCTSCGFISKDLPPNLYINIVARLIPPSSGLPVARFTILFYQKDHPYSILRTY